MFTTSHNSECWYCFQHVCLSLCLVCVYGSEDMPYRLVWTTMLVVVSILAGVCMFVSLSQQNLVSMETGKHAHPCGPRACIE